MRTFETGATRDSDASKFDYEGFLSPAVLHRYARYMHQHRVQADGGLRASDNWQKGIPLDAYIKSAFRHFMDWWTAHRRGAVDEDALCALLFNVMGYLHESLGRRNVAIRGPVVSREGRELFDDIAAATGAPDAARLPGRPQVIR